MSYDLPSAIRRLRAVIGVLDEDIAAADAARRTQDWYEKAELAVGRRDVVLARQAMAQAETAAEQAAMLTLECKELQVFLTEWAVRVTQARPPTPRKPRANER